MADVQLEALDVKALLNQMCQDLESKIETREMQLMKVIEQLRREKEQLIAAMPNASDLVADHHDAKLQVPSYMSSAQRWDRIVAESGQAVQFPDRADVMSQANSSQVHDGGHDADNHLHTNTECQSMITQMIVQESANQDKFVFVMNLSIPDQMVTDVEALTSKEQEIEEEMDLEELEINPAGAGPWYMLHPSGTSRLIWDSLTIPVLMWEMVGNPFVLAFEPDTNIVVETISWVCLLFWTMDIVVTSVSGYETRERYIIMNPHSVRQRYLTSWFGVDLVIISIDWFGQLSLLASSSNMISLLRIVKVARVLRIARVFKARKFTGALMDVMDESSEVVALSFKIFKYITIVITLNHLIACLWFYIGRHGDGVHGGWVDFYEITHRSTQYQYMTSLHWSLAQFTPAPMNVQPQNTMERVMAVSVLLVAVCVFSSFVSSITASMTSLRSLSASKQLRSQSLHRYMHMNHLSQKLAVSISKYFRDVVPSQEKHNNLKHVHLLDQLPDQLKSQLHHELFSPCLIVNPFFLKMQKNCATMLRSVCDKALQANFCPRHDIVFVAGVHSHSMYLVYDGKLQYRHNKRLLPEEILIAGDWVSEPALWTRWIHVGSLRAIADSEVCEVNSASLQKVVQAHPAYRELVMEYSSNLVSALNKTVLTHGVEALTDLRFFIETVPQELQDAASKAKANFSKRQAEHAHLTGLSKFASFIKGLQETAG